MNLTALFEKVAGKQQKRQQARLAGYRDLVGWIADGREPDADDVDRTLHEAGKTLEQLRRDVELLHRRRQHRRQYDQVAALEIERAELERKIAETDHVLDAARKEHEVAVAPFYARLYDIKKAIRAGEDARQQLIDTCDDQVLLDELEAVTERSRVASRRRFELGNEITQLRSAVEAVQHELTGEVFPGRAAQLHEQIEEHTARADDLEHELADVEKEIADLEQREREIYERMLLP